MNEDNYFGIVIFIYFCFIKIYFVNLLKVYINW